MEPKPPSSEPLPEYPSSFKYEIQKPDEIWQMLQNKKLIAACSEPDTGNNSGKIFLNGRLPTLKLENQCINLEISFSDFLIRNNKSPGFLQHQRNLEALFKDQKFQQELALSLQRYVSPDLRVNNGSLIKVKKTAEGVEYRETVGNLQNGYLRPFEWSPSDLIASKEEFAKRLEEGLKIAQIFLTEAYKANKLQVPTATLIISPDQQQAIDTDSEERMRRIQEIASKPKRDLSGIIPPNVRSPETVDRNAKDVRKHSDISDPKDIDVLARSIIIEERPNVSFEDIAGQDKAVEEAKGLAEQINHPEDFAKWGIESPRGIIFHGPPGTGKTLIAKALANKCEAPFVSIDGADVTSKWYGDTEKKITAVFGIARKKSIETSKPAILFIDEVDALARSRKDNNSHEASMRSLAIMLVQIDGLSTAEQKGRVVVVCATNRLENVDSAFLSRMTQWVEVPLPSQEGRARIFELQFAARAQKAGRGILTEGIDFNRISAELGEASGREIADIVEITLKHKAIKAKKSGEDALITEEEIMETIKSSEISRKTQREIRKGQIGFHKE